MKRVASALFTEWQGEIREIKGDPTLSEKSQELYDRTKDNYGEMSISSILITTHYPVTATSFTSCSRSFASRSS